MSYNPDELRVTYADAELIHGEIVNAKTADDTAIDSIGKALRSHVHTGASAEVSEALVEQLFRPWFTELNLILDDYDARMTNAMIAFAGADKQGATKLAG